jgi:hypothetical protein
VIGLALAITSLMLALIPAVLFFRNLRLYVPPPIPSESADTPPAVSLLIPARNEEAGIQATLEAALASEGVALEIIVLDDHSEDATAEIVAGLAARDARVRLESAPPLPDGWCGKQHACWALAGLATHPILAFLDADVRLAPHGLARSVAFLESCGADLISGVPRQETETLLEKLLIPLIHFILLGFLPMGRMRASRHPAYGAGCGQLFLARRDAYDRAGGHAAIRETLHDGIRLPRAFRSAGLATDLFDATDVATCRMYRSAKDVWNGLAKNAVEGLAAPKTILPATALLLGGQVMPIILCILGLASVISPVALAVSVLAAVVAYTPRLAAAGRFRQPILGGILHPLGICVFLAIQWYALFRRLIGKSAAWKGRDYAPSQPA